MNLNHEKQWGQSGVGTRNRAWDRRKEERGKGEEGKTEIYHSTHVGTDGSEAFSHRQGRQTASGSSSFGRAGNLHQATDNPKKNTVKNPGDQDYFLVGNHIGRDREKG